MHQSSTLKPKHFFILLFMLALSLIPSESAYAQSEKLYIPGGMPFGAKIYSDGVSISMFTDPKELGTEQNPSVSAGLKLGDVIKKINNTVIRDPDTLTNCINDSCGNELTVTVLRAGKEEKINVKAHKCTDGEYRLGISVRDSMAGIGTVTFICENSGAFGGLGHGICDSFTGDVIPILRGSVNNVKINNIIKGTGGKPGEIRGSFTPERMGTILKNSEKGVFGILSSVPSQSPQAIPAADVSEIKCGEASILCTLDGEGVKSYTVEIESIDCTAHSKTKNFLIKVTDKALIEKTGGIVQGMSGSPIIQNGRLCGAVTHVLVNEPQKGYGIYIGNMTEEIPALIA